jgi:hypothetical protein
MTSIILSLFFILIKTMNKVLNAFHFISVLIKSKKNDIEHSLLHFHACYKYEKDFEGFCNSIFLLIKIK